MYRKYSHPSYRQRCRDNHARRTRASGVLRRRDELDRVFVRGTGYGHAVRPLSQLRLVLIGSSFEDRTMGPVRLSIAGSAGGTVAERVGVPDVRMRYRKPSTPIPATVSPRVLGCPG